MGMITNDVSASLFTLSMFIIIYVNTRALQITNLGYQGERRQISSIFKDHMT